MKEIIHSVKRFLQDRFNLHEDKEEEQLIIDSIRKNVEFKGANLWALIFAILIASIGLNVNSTAVIIGAMLISPIMGPIMGIGLAVGINDFDLLKRGIKNLLIAAMFSIVTSCIYFYLTPLHLAQSELLARTNPSIWDVFIAFFGGLAGIVAGTRIQKGTVIPGVAIATALMPPLCTAGFGLATANMYYFFGALYLFFINSLFIAISTFLIVRYLNFQRKEFSDKRREKRVTRLILIVVIATILPSIYLAYRIVDKSIFESNARDFVQKEFNFVQTQVVNQSYQYRPDKKKIELLLIGRELQKERIDSIKSRMIRYKLANTSLVIKQGLNADQKIDFAQIRASILEDVVKRQKANDTANLASLPAMQRPIPDLTREVKALYPGLLSFSTHRSVVYRMDTLRSDTVIQVITSFKNPPSFPEKKKLINWLRTRMADDSVKLLIE